MDIRAALLQLRAELNMRQIDLASELGISPITLNRWENGKTKPSRAMSIAIISVAAANGASMVCRAALQDTLIEPAKTPTLDSLKSASVEQINNLVNNSSNAVMVCDAKTHELLYLNRQAGKITGQPVELAQGQKCYQFFLHRDTPCEDCPMREHTGDEFFTMEYESPVTGRHYMRRSRMLTWSGKKAHLEYITDITELRKTGKALQRSQELTALACKEANMWMFSLDLADGTAHVEPVMQKSLHLPALVPNFMDYLARHRISSDESMAQLRQMLEKLRRGQTPLELTLQVKLENEKRYWVRFRSTIAERDEQGNPLTAICSAQQIDNEKAVEARIQFEHEQILASRGDLMGYVIADITNNTIVEQHQILDKWPVNIVGSQYDDVIEATKKNIEPPEEQARFVKIHDRNTLMQRFQNGQLDDTMECLHHQPNGELIWVRVEMKLMPHPTTGNVFLYEYCYADHTRKILKGLLKTIFRNGYDTVAAVSMENDQVARLQLSEDGELQEQALMFASYTEETRAYCAGYVAPREREGFLRAMDLERVKKELETKDSYRVSYHERRADGTSRTMVSEYTICDRKYRFCLLSVWDQEAMRASINHVADTTSEALK